MDLLRHWIDQGRVHCLCGSRATGTTLGGVPECADPGCDAAVEFERAHPDLLQGAVEAADAMAGAFRAHMVDAGYGSPEREQVSREAIRAYEDARGR